MELGDYRVDRLLLRVKSHFIVVPFHVRYHF